MTLHIYDNLKQAGACDTPCACDYSCVRPSGHWGIHSCTWQEGAAR